MSDALLRFCRRIGRPGRLPASETRERMVEFFLTRLMTPSWMRALGEDDPTAALSFRTDHATGGAILEAVFGLRVPLHGPVSVARAAWDLVPPARIENLLVAGSRCRVVGGSLEEIS